MSTLNGLTALTEKVARRKLEGSIHRIKLRIRLTKANLMLAKVYIAKHKAHSGAQLLTDNMQQARSYLLRLTIRVWHTLVCHGEGCFANTACVIGKWQVEGHIFSDLLFSKEIIQNVGQILK